MLFRLLSNLVMYWYLMLVQDLAIETTKESVFFFNFCPENRPSNNITDRFWPLNYQKTDCIHIKPTPIFQKTDRIHIGAVGYKPIGYKIQDSVLPQNRPCQNRPHITDRCRIWHRSVLLKSQSKPLYIICYLYINYNNITLPENRPCSCKTDHFFPENRPDSIKTDRLPRKPTTGPFDFGRF